VTYGKKAEAFHLVVRDYDILQTIGRCGALTAEQIGLYIWQQVAVFPDKTKEAHNGTLPLKIAVHSNCQRRMKILYDFGFVRRVERYQLPSEGKKSYFYTLTPSGAESLASFLGCALEDLPWRRTDARLRPNYVEHLIMTNDVRLAVMRAVGRENPLWQLARWHDELILAKTHSETKIPLRQADGNVMYVSLVPDAYFVLRNNEGHESSFFLEVDRGTETTTSNNESYRTWARKMATYVSYFYARRGETALYTQQYHTTAGRLLTVTTSKERLARLMAVSEKVGAGARYWFTTYDQITQMVPYQVSGEINKKGNPKYEVTLPNILSNEIWDFVGNTDGRLHTLSERR